MCIHIERERETERERVRNSLLIWGLYGLGCFVLRERMKKNRKTTMLFGV